MANNREKSLLDEITWHRSVLALGVLVTLLAAYAAVWYWLPDDNTFLGLARQFTLDVIGNLFPTFLLFLGAYLLFRRSDTVRSQHQLDEIAELVSIRVIEKTKAMESELHEKETGPDSVMGSDEPRAIVTSDRKVT